MKYNLKKPAVLDVSRWQGQVDWSTVAPTPVLVICKASEGVDSMDTTFVSNWANLKALNLGRGAYHFFHAEMDAGQQFQNYKNAIAQAGGFLPTDMPPALGVEGLEVAAPEIQRGAAAAIKTWLDQAQAFSGKMPVIYTSKYQWSFVTDQNGKTPAWSGSYPLWVAWYPDKPDNFSAPAAGVIHTGWTQWAVWQYADNGQNAHCPDVRITHDGQHLVPGSAAEERIGGVRQAVEMKAAGQDDEKDHQDDIYRDLVNAIIGQEAVCACQYRSK